MFNGLHEIDWSSMHHAYGSAEDVPGLLIALRSDDEGEREEALSGFYSAVHHQGDVYPCTTASLPFLFAMAADPSTPDRAAIVALIVSIGEIAVDRAGEHPWENADHAGAAALVRAHADTLVACATGDDRLVRRAAIRALGLFVDDPQRALRLLRDRLAAEPGTVERLLVIEAVATLALRLPAVADDALAWLGVLATEAAVDPETRLGAVVHRARCTPQRIDDDLVPAVVALLWQIAADTVVDGPWPDEPVPDIPGDGVPPEVVAAFADMDRGQRVHAVTTDLLTTLHELLDGRLAERTALLLEQLRSPDSGARLDAIRMSARLVVECRGDHSELVTLVARQLADANPEVAAEAASFLRDHSRIAEPAREALAARVAADRAAHGPEVWAAARPRLRRAHQEAVLALARLGDVRAVPSLLVALTSDVDAWRAVQQAGRIPSAASVLSPPIAERLGRHARFTDRGEMSTNAMLAALAALGDPVAVPVLADTLASAVRHESWVVAGRALEALAAFGPAASGALELMRSLTASDKATVRPAAVGAVLAVGGDVAEAIGLLLGLLDDHPGEAARMLGSLGPRAVVALPRLREFLGPESEWVAVRAAAAVWEIGGVPEAGVVLGTLLRAWERSPALGYEVVACLERMGASAEPAVPHLLAELARPERRDLWFRDVGEDEDLQRACRDLVATLI
ncbi:hypothetical protein AB0M02_39490 [Actinoplanes sp. NPDC051861]|uniref:hypothetical protein n=1 Tax=Actinoplanes sp. NPDC051861 TaxID=3155170 RepID=UPI003412427A